MISVNESVSLLFQSTPAIAGRRIRSRRSRHRCRCGFNPLRPLLAGESCTPGAAPRRSCTFQSTPAIAGRRIAEEKLGDDQRGVSIHSGHCWPENLYATSGEMRVMVSIHSGHCWPENPHALVVGVLVAGGFNPLRPLLAGESMPYAKQIAVVSVSIHSGHCWPENPTPAASRVW